MKKYLKAHWAALAVSVIFTQLVGVVSLLLSGDMQAYYNALIKPPLAPPDWLFGVAWPVLYLIIGIAACLVYTSTAHREQKRHALWTYAIQLAVNCLWSLVFFRFHMMGLAIAVLVALIALVIKTMQWFNRIHKLSMQLMIPYLLWLLYATYLNIGIFWLNR